MTYRFRLLYTISGSLVLVLDKTIPGSLKSALTLNIDGTALLLKAAPSNTSIVTNDTLVWNNTGLSWAAGDTVQLSLTGSASSAAEAEPQQIFPALDRLPRHPSVEPFPARLRIPEGGSASDAYCYIGEGNDKTEYVRYPNGRIAETTRQSDATRTAYACD